MTTAVAANLSCVAGATRVSVIIVQPPKLAFTLTLLARADEVVE
jgi:hypothetical protein